MRTSVLLRGMVHALSHRDGLVCVGGTRFRDLKSTKLRILHSVGLGSGAVMIRPWIISDHTGLEIVIELARRMSLGRTLKCASIGKSPGEVKLGNLKEPRGTGPARALRVTVILASKRDLGLISSPSIQNDDWQHPYYSMPIGPAALCTKHAALRIVLNSVPIRLSSCPGLPMKTASNVAPGLRWHACGPAWQDLGY